MADEWYKRRRSEDPDFLRNRATRKRQLKQEERVRETAALAASAAQTFVQSAVLVQAVPPTLVPATFVQMPMMPMPPMAFALRASPPPFSLVFFPPLDILQRRCGVIVQQVPCRQTHRPTAEPNHNVLVGLRRPPTALRTHACEPTVVAPPVGGTVVPHAPVREGFPTLGGSVQSRDGLPRDVAASETILRTNTTSSKAGGEQQ